MRDAVLSVSILPDMQLKKKTISSFYNHTRAFVKIENGCENFAHIVSCRMLGRCKAVRKRRLRKRWKLSVIMVIRRLF